MSRHRLREVLRGFAALVTCSGALVIAGCGAARQVPGEAAYMQQSVLIWPTEILGIEPKEY